MSRIAFFDFDGTITHSDTLFEIIRYHKGSLRTWLGMFFNAHWIAAYRLGIVPNDVAKEKLMRYFFRGIPAEEFREKNARFAKDILPSLVRKKALDEINKLRELSFEIVVVTASADTWISGWSESVSAVLISTRLEVKEGKMTGKIDGKNCYGEEKRNQIEKAFDLNSYSEIYCYGDTPGDLPMLALGSRVFYKPFR